MEDIKKAIEEEAVRCYNDTEGSSTPEEYFIAGATFYAHLTRWRKVEEELPEMGIEVILKMKGGKYEIGWLSVDSDYYFDTTYSEFWLDQVESWKPID